MTKQLVQLAGVLVSFTFVRNFDVVRDVKEFAYKKLQTEQGLNCTAAKQSHTYFPKAFFSKFHTRLIFVKLLPPEKTLLFPRPREKG
jgi:hypothetical protein